MSGAGVGRDPRLTRAPVGSWPFPIALDAWPKLCHSRSLYLSAGTQRATGVPLVTGANQQHTAKRDLLSWLALAGVLDLDLASRISVQNHVERSASRS